MDDLINDFVRSRRAFAASWSDAADSSGFGKQSPCRACPYAGIRRKAWQKQV